MSAFAATIKESLYWNARKISSKRQLLSKIVDACRAKGLLRPNVSPGFAYVNEETQFLVHCLLNDRHPPFTTSWAKVRPASVPCKACGNRVRVTRERIAAYCEESDFNFLGLVDEGESVGKESFFFAVCRKCDYTWRTTWAVLHNQKSKCPQCVGRRRLTAHVVLDTAESWGWKGQVLSKGTLNSRMEIELKCDISTHRAFSRRWSAIKEGSWCPLCTGHHKRKRLTIEKPHDLARRLGGIFVSQTFVNVTERYDWLCQDGHPFRRSYREANNGHWCQTCKTLQRLEENAEEFAAIVTGNHGLQRRPIALIAQT